MNNLKKRITVFFMYDKDGVVRDYVFHLVKSLKDISNYLVIVSNGPIADNYKNKLLDCCDEIFERENFGFDVWAYKEAFEHISWDILTEYEELVFANFTCYGPIFPFSEMFKKMENSDADFWGAVKEPEQNSYLLPPNGGYINEHIMSYFTVIRHKMLASLEFKYYWDNVPKITSKKESTALHEVVFTKYFEDLGFKSDSFVNLNKFRGRCNNSSIIKADELLINERCPLLKRHAFIFPSYVNNLDVAFSNQAKALLDYVDQNTDYDVNLIWDDILATTPLSIIKNNLQSIKISDLYKVDLNSTDFSKHCIVINILENTILKVIQQVLFSIPSNCKVLINSSIQDESIFEGIPSENIKLFHSDTGISKFLLSVKEIISEYETISVLVLHNEKVQDLSITDEDIYKYSSHVLFGSIYSLAYQINNLKDTVGLFVPNIVNFAQYFGQPYLDLNKHLSSITDVLKALNIKVPLDKVPLSNGFPCFTTKVDLLIQFCKQLEMSNINEEVKNNLEVFPQILPIWIQSNKLYTNWIVTKKYAETELNNDIFMKHFLLEKMSKENNINVWTFKTLVGALYRNFKTNHNNNNNIEFNTKYEMLNYSYTVSDAFKVLRRSVIRKIKNLFHFSLNIKKEKKNKLVQKIKLTAYVRGLNIKNDLLTIMIHFNSNIKELPYLNVGDSKIYPTEDLSTPQEILVSTINSKLNKKSKFYIYKFDVKKLIEHKFFSMNISSDYEVYLDYINYEPPYNLSDFKKYNRTANIVQGKFYCLTKYGLLKKLLPNTEFKTKFLYILEYLNPLKYIWLFSENEGANDNAYELFKYTVDNHRHKCYFVCTKKDIVEDKYQKYTVTRNSFKHYLLLNLASKVFTSFTYIEALPSEKMAINRFHLSFIDLEWFFIPHGMFVDKIAYNLNSLAWGDPKTLYAYNKVERDNWHTNSEMTNIKYFGFPRFRKWINSSLDKNQIFIFFTWRQEFNSPSFSMNDFINTKYYQNIVYLLDDIIKKMPQAKIFYAFHHEMVRHGFNAPLKEYLTQINKSEKLVPVYYNSRNEINKFNRYFLTAKYLITDVSSVAYDFARKKDSIVINFVNNDFIKGHYSYNPKHAVGYIIKNVENIVPYLRKIENSKRVKQNRKVFYFEQDVNACENIINDSCNQ